MPITTYERNSLWERRPRWFDFVAVLILEAALTTGLLLLEPLFPLAHYPIPYVLLTLVIAYAFSEGPAILSIFLGWLLFTYFFVPPHGLTWPLASTLDGWARQIALLLGVIVVGTAMIQARRSKQRIQQIVVALKESEDDLNRAQAVAQTGSWRLDVHQDLLLWSDQNYRIFDVPLGTPLTYEIFLGAVHPEDREYVDRNWREALSGKSYDVEHRIIAGGKIKWVRERAELELDQQGNLLGGFGTTQDITERKQAEAALKESEERVRRKLESILSPEGDIGTLELSDIIDVPKIQSIMNSFYELIQIPIAILDINGNVLVGTGWQDICTQFHRVHPDTCNHCMESDTVLTGNVPEGEYRLYKCKNGMWDVATPVMIAGRHIGNIFVGQFFLDDEPINYDYFRSQAEKYGFNKDDYIKALDKVQRISKNKVEYAMSFFIELSDLLSKLGYGNIKLARALAERENLIGSLHDREEQLRERVAEIRRLNAELEQRVKERTIELETANKELEAFSYSVSHDLRAPLRAIDGFSNALLKHYHEALDEQGKDYLARVRAAANRMGLLIDDILDLSRASRVEMHRQRIDLSSMAKDIMQEFKTSQPQRNAEVSIEEGLVVNGDNHLIRIALNNLLGNAWKFTGKREITRIEIGKIDQDTERVFFIKDNGVGFDSKYADRLFSPFQRLHSESEFPGTGIGLALVQRILRRHGGRIWAQSSEDEGATFFFTFGEEK